MAHRERLASRLFTLYGNLLGEEEHQIWEKMVNTQMEAENYLDVYGVTHHDIAGKSEDSFVECIRMHLLTHFSSNAREKEKQYIKLGPRKPCQIPKCQRGKRVSALNEYL